MDSRGEGDSSVGREGKRWRLEKILDDIGAFVTDQEAAWGKEWLGKMAKTKGRGDCAGENQAIVGAMSGIGGKLLGPGMGDSASF